MISSSLMPREPCFAILLWAISQFRKPGLRLCLNRRFAVHLRFPWAYELTIQRHSYLLVRKAFEDFHQAFDARFTNAEAAHDSDLHQKFCILLPFVFEAVIFMAGRTEQCVESLSSIIDLAKSYRVPVKTYMVLADTILAAQVFPPVNTAERSMKPLPAYEAGNLICKLVEAIRSYSSYSVLSASSWIRCIVQVVINGLKRKEAMWISADSDLQHSIESGLLTVESLAHQAVLLSRKSYASLPANQIPVAKETQDANAIYPPIELEHLSTTLFNLAIDLYVAERDETATKMAKLALRIAEVPEHVFAFHDSSAGNWEEGNSIEGLEGARALAGVLRRRMNELGWRSD